MLAQGGLIAHDHKNKTSRLAVIRCSMFIMCQTDMDFGLKHNGAMAVCLRKFFFKRLTSLHVVGVQEFLQTHASYCIVWACSLAITPDDELPVPMSGTSVQQGDIGEEEKNRLETCNWTKAKATTVTVVTPPWVKYPEKRQHEAERVARRARERVMMAVVRATQRG